jgi:isoquinoline 1-oxidoreductase subunit alpha
MVRLTVNQRDYTVDTRPDTPLLWALDAAMAGNICPCGTYQRIRRAIHRAARIAGGAR